MQLSSPGYAVVRRWCGCDAAMRRRLSLAVWSVEAGCPVFQGSILYWPHRTCFVQASSPWLSRIANSNDTKDQYLHVSCSPQSYVANCID